MQCPDIEGAAGNGNFMPKVCCSMRTVSEAQSKKEKGAKLDASCDEACWALCGALFSCV